MGICRICIEDTYILNVPVNKVLIVLPSCACPYKFVYIRARAWVYVMMSLCGQMSLCLRARARPPTSMMKEKTWVAARLHACKSTITSSASSRIHGTASSIFHLPPPTKTPSTNCCSHRLHILAPRWMLLPSLVGSIWTSLDYNKSWRRLEQE